MTNQETTKVEEKNRQSTDEDIRELIRRESRGYDVNSPTNESKRWDYLTWDDYFLAVACLSSMRSKDPAPNLVGGGGACVVDALGGIVGIGYDGFPRGFPDDCLPWTSTSNVEEGMLPWLQTKEPYLCRAKINAILNKCSDDIVGGRM